MIEIQDIKTDNINDIINSLLNKDTGLYEIFIPKLTQVFSSSNEDIANDYAMLAYAGQKLNEIAEDFRYYYVSPCDHKSVLFVIKASNIKQLAEIILHISYGYGNDSTKDETDYLDDVYDFIEKVQVGKVIPICSDFIEEYQKYNNHPNRDNDIF